MWTICHAHLELQQCLYHFAAVEEFCNTKSNTVVTEVKQALVPTQLPI